MHSGPGKKTRIAVYAALTLLIAAAYWQAPFHEFVDYDDPLYVTDSPITQGGITWEGIRWALTDTSSGNWHPLTRVAHMLDCELFGLNPTGHHAMSVLWHIAATLLLLGVLSSITGAFWPSAFTAALFGLHPLHVESVAWISERKDVMSAVCWFAAMGLYARYARSPSAPRCVAVAIVLAIGLMVKAMLVTLPCALLLLDVWPLRRFEDTQDRIIKRAAILFAEKMPLFAIVALHAIVTMQTQRIAMTPTSVIPLPHRVENAILSYAAYVGQTFWPSGLAVYYPYPAQEGLFAQALVVGAMLVAITVCAVWLVRRAPYVTVGWLWFIGTLVPVIGLVQVGLQSRADRYTYIPSVGLFIAAAWIGAAVVKARPALRKPAAAVAVAIVFACAVLSSVQSRYWADSFTLFQHALAVTDDNLIAHTNVGHECFARGDYEHAKEHFNRAIEIGKRWGWVNTIAPAYFGLGQIAEAEDDLGAAERFYIEARVADGTFSEAHNNLAGVHMEMGRRAFKAGDAEQGNELYASALNEAELAFQYDPNNFDAALNAAFLFQHFADQEHDAELYKKSAARYRLAVPYFDAMPDVHYNYSLVLEQLGDNEAAIQQAERALALEPNYERAQAALKRYRIRATGQETATMPDNDA